MSIKDTTNARPIQERGLIDGERWAVILDGNYAVSDHGRMMRTSGLKTGSASPGKILKGFVDIGGYHIQDLYVSAKRRKVRVHCAVAERFVGTCDPGMDVNHKDGNKLNNHYGNLEYMTRGDNMLHAYQSGLMAMKLSNADVLRIIEDLKSGESQKSIAGRNGISQAHVSDIKLGKARKNVRSSSQ